MVRLKNIHKCAQRLTASKVKPPTTRIQSGDYNPSAQRLTASKVKPPVESARYSYHLACAQRLTASKVKPRRSLKALASKRSNPSLQASPKKTNNKLKLFNFDSIPI